jgi:hypothetical protein
MDWPGCKPGVSSRRPAIKSSEPWHGLQLASFVHNARGCSTLSSEISKLCLYPKEFCLQVPSRWWRGRTYCSLRIITIPIIYKYCKRNKEFKYLLSDSSVVFFKFVQTILLYFRNYCRSMTNHVLTGRSWRKIICNGDLFPPIIVGNQPIFCLHDFSYRVNSLVISFSSQVANLLAAYNTAVVIQ